ncbi:glycerophosphoryl diester phosphodiesterase membrane domain-containing protein [Streptomyces sp. NPDC049954]|uniref:glycerophosphoryl diester phosphodiesterase membrane domain-containing protein n=1 Tax=Streptomyces sp. NPDC049954 TaxID=3155779 RepID=UPI00341D2F4C
MNDTPGWASPGSGPSNGPDRSAQGEDDHGQDVRDQDGSRSRAADDRDGPDGRPADDQWAKQQPPPASWTSPGTPGPGPQSPSGVPGRQPQVPPQQGPPQQHGPQSWGAPGTPPSGPPPAPPGPGGGGPGGGWGAPGNGWGGPGGGWGGGPAGWGGPPPAAKPGVIPLRPLGVGEILDGAVSTMRAYWRPVLGISLTVAAFTQVLSVVVQGLFLDSVDSDALSDPSASFSEISDALGTTLVGSAVVQLIALLGSIVATAMLTMIISRAVIARPATTGEAWRDARPQLWRLLGVTLLVPVIVIATVLVCTLPGIVVSAVGPADGGLALAVLGGLAGLVLAVWLYVRFVLASPALMLEKQGVIASLRRSAKLVRGSWWRVFGIQLLTLVLAVMVQGIIGIPFGLIAAVFGGDQVGNFLVEGGDFGWTYLIVSAVGTVIATTFTFPITAGVTVLLYVDQRIRREALDIELASAANRQAPGRSDAAPGS